MANPSAASPAASAMPANTIKPTAKTSIDSPTPLVETAVGSTSSISVPSPTLSQLRHEALNAGGTVRQAHEEDRVEVRADLVAVLLDEGPDVSRMPPLVPAG